MDLSDLITDPACIVPFIYSMKPSRVSELLPSLMSLPHTEGVFSLDISRLLSSSSSKKDLVFEALTLPDCDPIQHQLRRQVALTDLMIL